MFFCSVIYHLNSDFNSLQVSSITNLNNTRQRLCQLHVDIEQILLAPSILPTKV